MRRGADFSIQFWDLVGQSGGSFEALKKLLAEKPEAFLRAFHEEFQQARAKLTDYKAGALLRAGEASEDVVDDIVIHVIGKGKEYYERILLHPELIPRDVDPDDAALAGAARMVFRQKFGKHIDQPD